MAFGDETERAAWSAVQRWNVPVRAVLIGDNAEAYRADVRALFAEFGRLTGVPFTLSDGDSDANLRIFFPRATGAARRRGARSRGLRAWCASPAPPWTSKAPSPTPIRSFRRI